MRADPLQIDASEGKTKPNILLVILDSARARNMSAYGYERETTPFLSRFSDSATLYTQARSPGIHSIASHVSMFTGEEVEEHDAIEHGTSIDPSRTIWHDLSCNLGYETSLFTANYVVCGASNLAECFDYSYEPKLRAEKRRSAKLFEDAYAPVDRDDISSVSAHAQQSLRSETPLRSLANCAWDAVVTIEDEVRSSDRSAYGGKFVNEFCDWKADQNGPWAACLNLMDTHYPYEPESEFNEWGDEELRARQDNMPSTKELLLGERWDDLAALEPLYDGTIRQADAVVETLVNRLSQSGDLDNTMVVITSDHGEGFGERSLVDPEVKIRYHSWGIHEVLTHVPLIVSYPNRDSGSTVEQAVSLASFPAAVRAVVENKSISEPFARSRPVLTSTYRFKQDQITQYAEVDGVDKFRGPWRAVYDTRNHAVRKYAQRDDDYATVDIRSAQKVETVNTDSHDRAESAFENLTKSGLVDQPDRDLDDDLEQHLEDLGYIR